MATRLLLALALGSASAAPTSSSPAADASAGLSSALTCGPAGPDYSVALDGAPLFAQPPALALFGDGAWARSWVLSGAADVSGSDALGAYVGTECSYALAAAPALPIFTAAAYTYAAAATAASASLVRFRYSVPQGARRTNHSAVAPATFSTVSNFPAFAGDGAGTARLPNVLTWRDAFFAPSNSVPDALGQIASTVVFYGADVAGRAVVLSPMDQFLNTALGDDLGDGSACTGKDAACWAAGAAAAVTSLPPGFAHNFVLVADTGFTAAVDSWGRVMRGYYGATSPRLNDLSLNTLGYQTDNGAQLCFGCDNALDACLLAEKAYLDQLKVPIQYLSFQNGWWISGAESAPWCIGEWVPSPRKVPMGMQAFQQQLGLPLQLYAPYFCASSDYANNYSMVRSNPKLPGCDDFDFYDASPEAARQFYEFLFDLGEAYGMTMFEPDFLNANHVCVPRFIEEVGAADAFFGAQAGVALERGIPIQWCFCTPMLLMWTLSAPAVTNFRVSYDFAYGGSWDIGRSSLIVWAMGKAPSKDNFWTTDNGNQSTTRGACDKTGCPPDHSTPAASLHTMLAALSTGPVGFGDAPNETDAVLIKRTCDASGLLLQPSKPLTAVDSTHDVNANAAPSGYALVTHTSVGGRVWLHMTVSHSMKSAFALRALDWWPALVPALPYALATWSALQRCGAGTGCGGAAVAIVAPSDPHAVVADLPAVVNGTDPFTPVLVLVAPECTSGVALFGEIDKFATISVQRFTALACSASGASFTLSGVPAESVRIAWWTAAGGVRVASAAFAAGGQQRVRLACEVTSAGELNC